MWPFGSSATARTGETIAIGSTGPLDYVPINNPTATIGASIDIAPGSVFDDAVDRQSADRARRWSAQRFLNCAKSRSERRRIAGRRVIASDMDGSRRRSDSKRVSAFHQRRHTRHA